MYDLKKLILLATSLSAAVSSPVDRRQTSSSLDSWMSSENPVALQGVLNNIGSAGSKAQGAAPGIVVASPSKSNPNCKWRP